MTVHVMSLSITNGLKSSDINDYSDEGHLRKVAFHYAGRRFLNKLAQVLGLAPTSFEVRCNLAGIAVSGEVTLHAERLYVQLSESAVGGGGVSILYRSCKGRKDYTGGQNHWKRIADLERDGALERFVESCQRLMNQ